MSPTTVHRSTRYPKCIVCDTCGATFTPGASTTFAWNLTTMGGPSYVGPVTYGGPGRCPGCNREHGEAP